MTFTFSIDGGFTDRDRVRFHVGDTDATAPILTDEQIAALITEYDDWIGATRAALRYIIAQLTRTPNFQADWLKVDVANTVKLFRQTLADFEAEFADAYTVEATAVHTHRADSGATGVYFDDGVA